MKAVLICKNLNKAINDGEIFCGEVHSVFKNTCNIETDIGLVSILSMEKCMYPMSLKTDCRLSFIEYGLNRNQNFIFEKNRICCIEKNFCIELKNVEEWPSGIIFNRPACMEKEVLDNIRILGAELDRDAQDNFILKLLKEELDGILIENNSAYDNRLIEFIKHRFSYFITKLREVNPESISNAAGSLIGFGMGLTPAMDDFICGIMVSFLYSGLFYNSNLEKLYKLNRKIIDTNLNKTTKISSKMLKHSAAGEACQTVGELLQAVFSRKDDINERLKKTLNIGGTSGSDIAVGIYAGLRIFTEYVLRGDRVNEGFY